MLDFTLRDIIDISIKDIDSNIKSHNIRDFSTNRKLYDFVLDLYVFVSFCCEMGFIKYSDFIRYYNKLKFRLLKLDKVFNFIKGNILYEERKEK